MKKLSICGEKPKEPWLFCLWIPWFYRARIRVVGAKKSEGDFNRGNIIMVITRWWWSHSIFLWTYSNNHIQPNRCINEQLNNNNKNVCQVDILPFIVKNKPVNVTGIFLQKIITRWDISWPLASKQVNRATHAMHPEQKISQLVLFRRGKGGEKQSIFSGKKNAIWGYPFC